MGIRHSRSFTIVEMLAYMAIITIVMDVAGVAWYRMQKHSQGLYNCFGDITGAVNAGERWRREVRAADAPPRLDAGVLCLPQGKNALLYRFADGAVQRKHETDKEWRTVLANVRASRMTEDRRKNLTCWRWELELKTRSDKASVTPLFTFEAVNRRKASQ